MVKRVIGTNRRTRLKAGLKARRWGVSRSAQVLAWQVGLHVAVRIDNRQTIYDPCASVPWSLFHEVEPLFGTEALQTLRVYKKKLRKTLARLAHATGIPCYLFVEPFGRRRGLWHAAIQRIRPVAHHLHRGPVRQRMTAMVLHRAFGRHVLRRSHRCTADAEKLYSGIRQVLSDYYILYIYIYIIVTDSRDMYRLVMVEHHGSEIRIAWQWSIAPVAIMIFCRLNVPADLSHAIFGFSSVDDGLCCHRWYTTSDAGMTVRNPAI